MQRYEFKTVGYVTRKCNEEDRIRYFKTFKEAKADYENIKEDKRFDLISLEANKWKVVLQTDRFTNRFSVLKPKGA